MAVQDSGNCRTANDLRDACTQVRPVGRLVPSADVPERKHRPDHDLKAWPGGIRPRVPTVTIGCHSRARPVGSGRMDVVGRPARPDHVEPRRPAVRVARRFAWGLLRAGRPRRTRGHAESKGVERTAEDNPAPPRARASLLVENAGRPAHRAPHLGYLDRRANLLAPATDPPAA